jgi:hypothetical protein
MRAQPRLDEDLTLFVVDETIYHAKPIEGWQGYYASTCGHIISTKGNSEGSPLVMREAHDKDGYRRLNLKDSGCERKFYVHRLVAAAFLECPDADPKGTERLQVNHIDSDPSNNKVANLEWCSPQENMAHAWMMKRIREAQEGDPLRG